MSKLIYGAALLLTFAAAGASTRKAADTEVVLRSRPNGEWQMFVFGPSCPSYKNMQVIYPKDPTQPIEIECDLLAK